MFKDKETEQYAKPKTEMTVAEARRNFRNACSVYEPLGAVRRHPFVSPLIAMLAGFTFASFRKPAVAGVAAIPVALQIAQLAVKLILGLRKK